MPYSTNQHPEHSGNILRTKARTPFELCSSPVRDRWDFRSGGPKRSFFGADRIAQDGPLVHGLTDSKPGVPTLVGAAPGRNINLLEWITQ